MSSPRTPHAVVEKSPLPTENSVEIKQDNPTFFGSLSQSFWGVFTRTAAQKSTSPRTKTIKEHKMAREAEKDCLIEEEEMMPAQSPKLVNRVFGGL